MRTEITRRRRSRKQGRARPREKTPAPIPETRALDEDELTPLADELVVQGDRGFEEWSSRVEPDPEATPW